MVTPVAQKYGSLPVMAHILGTATILVTPFGVYGLTQSSFAWPAFIATLAVGALGTGAAFYMMGVLVGSVGATRSAFMAYVIPVVALTLGVIFRDETVAALAVAGVVMVIGGAFLASRSET
jgi:drug/metabolite transporter (DMT)-like permease